MVFLFEGKLNLGGDGGICILLVWKVIKSMFLRPKKMKSTPLHLFAAPFTSLVSWSHSFSLSHFSFSLFTMNIPSIALNWVPFFVLCSRECVSYTNISIIRVNICMKLASRALWLKMCIVLLHLYMLYVCCKYFYWCSI